MLCGQVVDYHMSELRALELTEVRYYTTYTTYYTAPPVLKC